MMNHALHIAGLSMLVLMPDVCACRGEETEARTGGGAVAGRGESVLLGTCAYGGFAAPPTSPLLGEEPAPDGRIVDTRVN